MIVNRVFRTTILALLAVLAAGVNCEDDHIDIVLLGPPPPDARDRPVPTDGAGAIPHDDGGTVPVDDGWPMPRDDGGGPAWCGNGVCETGETEANCPEDCAAPPQEGRLSCQMVIACLGCCPEGDQACAEACVAAGTAQAQRQLPDFVACVRTHCSNQCGPTGSRADCRMCSDANCRAEWDACDFGPAGDAGCMTMVDCLMECPDLPEDDSGNSLTCPTDEGINCFNDCFVMADQNAVNLFLALNRCVFENCEAECVDGHNGCSACIRTHCEDERLACFYDR